MVEVPLTEGTVLEHTLSPHPKSASDPFFHLAVKYWGRNIGSKATLFTPQAMFGNTSGASEKRSMWFAIIW